LETDKKTKHNKTQSESRQSKYLIHSKTTTLAYCLQNMYLFEIYFKILIILNIIIFSANFVVYKIIEKLFVEAII